MMRKVIFSALAGVVVLGFASVGVVLKGGGDVRIPQLLMAIPGGELPDMSVVSTAADMASMMDTIPQEATVYRLEDADLSDQEVAETAGALRGDGEDGRRR